MKTHIIQDIYFNGRQGVILARDHLNTGSPKTLLTGSLQTQTLGITGKTPSGVAIVLFLLGVTGHPESPQSERGVARASFGIGQQEYDILGLPRENVFWNRRIIIDRLGLFRNTAGHHHRFWLCRDIASGVSEHRHNLVLC